MFIKIYFNILLIELIDYKWNYNERVLLKLYSILRDYIYKKNVKDQISIVN